LHKSAPASSLKKQKRRDLPDAITRNDAVWKHWYDEDCPEAVKIPDFDDRIEMYFDKLLLIRALREDRALLGVQEYVMDALGERYADSRPLGIRALTEEANKFTPAIFILPTGADPVHFSGLGKRTRRSYIGQYFARLIVHDQSRAVPHIPLHKPV
jgi:dynein heavy chain